MSSAVRRASFFPVAAHSGGSNPTAQTWIRGPSEERQLAAPLGGDQRGRAGRGLLHHHFLRGGLDLKEDALWYHGLA